VLDPFDKTRVDYIEGMLRAQIKGQIPDRAKPYVQLLADYNKMVGVGVVFFTAGGERQTIKHEWKMDEMWGYVAFPQETIATIQLLIG
jgi:hypothetical protein